MVTNATSKKKLLNQNSLNNYMLYDGTESRGTSGKTVTPQAPTTVPESTGVRIPSVVPTGSAQNGDWSKFYNDSKQLLEDNYASGVKKLDENKRASEEMAAVTRDRLLHYIPHQLKAQGIYTQGISEDAAIKALNNYQGTMAGIFADYADDVAALDKERAEGLLGIEESRLTREEAKKNKENSDAYGVVLENYTTMLADENNYTEDGKLTHEAKEKLENYLESNKDVLGEGVFRGYRDALNNIEHITAEEAAKAVEVEKVSGRYNIRLDGNSFDPSNANTADVIDKLDVSEGKHQTALVNRVVEKSKSWGSDKNGTVIDLNYGSVSGSNEGNYYVFYNGRWYETKYTRYNCPEDAIEIVLYPELSKIQ